MILLFLLRENEMSYLYLNKQNAAAGQRGIVCGNTFLPIPDRTVTSSVAVTDGLEVYADGSSTTANIGTIACSSQATISNGVLVTNSSTDETTGSVQLYGAVTESSATGNDFNGTLCLAFNFSGTLGCLVGRAPSVGLGFSIRISTTTEGDPAAAGSSTIYEIYGPNSSDSTTNTVAGSIQRDLTLWVYLFLRASETESDKLDVYLTNNPENLNKIGEIYKTYLFDVLQYEEEYRYHTAIGTEVFVGSSGSIQIRSLRLYNRRLSDAEMSNLVCELNAPEQFEQALSFTTTAAPAVGQKGLVIELPKEEMPSSGLVFHAPFDSNTTTAATGQALTFRSSGIEFGTYKGIPSVSMTRGTAAVSFPATGLPTSNSPFTISVWFLNPSNDEQESIIIWGPESAGQMIFLNFHNGQLSLDTWFGDTSIDVENLFADEWQLLDTVYDGETLKFYINSVLVGSATVTLGTGSASTAYIGGHPQHEFGWSGRLADLRVYNRALSVSELKTLYGKYQKRRFFLPLEEAEGTPEAGTTGVLLNSQNAVLATANRIFIPIVKPSILSRLRSTVAGNKGKAYSTEQSWISFPSVNSEYKWIGGVLAKNGKIYCIPHYAPVILVIDTATDTATTIPAESGNLKWFGGCLAPNGKIYCIPHTSSKVLVIDPETDETHTFSAMSGDRKWAGGILGPDGKIYCIPCQEYRIGVIDPETESVETFGNVELGISYSWKWIGGALGPDNCIYAFPSNYRNSYVLKIDPAARTTQLIAHGLSAETGEQFQGCVFDSGERIFGVSCWFNDLASYSTATGEVSTHGSLGDGISKWYGGCLAPNGKLYFAPHNNGSILEVDSETASTVMLPIVDTSHGSKSKFRGGVVAPNGSIYFIPYETDAVLKLSFTGGITPFEKDVCESRWLNKL